jgi:hypothetical protein
MNRKAWIIVLKTYLQVVSWINDTLMFTLLHLLNLLCLNFFNFRSITILHNLWIIHCVKSIVSSNVNQCSIRGGKQELTTSLNIVNTTSNHILNKDNQWIKRQRKVMLTRLQMKIDANEVWNNISECINWWLFCKQFIQLEMLVFGIFS